ncbi:flavohemoglobin expression-modulating QEGLA motif protein [Enterovibrio sp. ZSDZ35]|uniref:Flavohemoglobin expression-modulating QEGLA motif protein n=1 Tax=Enterovibrio qingdaonensis TaxID=2899818 RepID=A0ABT5QNS6_9GAMM|nr:flavohemoglobin expression-modulating QEGLA motif protein [Enterovibrio sp. ZSDZ35]MDD1781936.1 flavohemoglobin expression-modulating QEGLA motif protein [Enterovibrio sp. ZSDZ35]
MDTGCLTYQPCTDLLHAAKLDDALFNLVNGIEILSAVSPQNYKEQKADFFKRHYSFEPTFTYKENVTNAFRLKRHLFNLPVEKVEDPDLQTIYEDVIVSYADKVDQLQSIGSNEFLYNSLRYFGEPTEKDIRNATFILHLPDSDDDECALVDAQGIQHIMEAFAQGEGYDYQLLIDDNMIANALVSGTSVKINSCAQVPLIEANALAHHELGVHLVTTLNARAQPLKILSLGCPVNTMTQEGMAILSEYLAGHLSIKRLKILALRVLAVESMIKDKSFRTTFMMLKEQYGVERNLAFTITARVFRGGGFTKDYLYLKGFHEVLNAYEQEEGFMNLLCGKTALKHLPQINRLVEKGIFIPPKKITPSFNAPQDNDEIRRFITHAIK